MGILGGSQAGVRPGAGSATLARILGVFRGAAGLLINVFFGQVLVCFFVRGVARCGAVRRGVARCGAVRRGVARCGVGFSMWDGNVGANIWAIFF